MHANVRLIRMRGFKRQIFYGPANSQDLEPASGPIALHLVVKAELLPGQSAATTAATGVPLSLRKMHTHVLQTRCHLPPPIQWQALPARHNGVSYSCK